uniref:Xanthine-uracil permease n=1 Tax=uncultured Thiotrichaceae bacterium TaxID=298394 RepID=A0A6S6UAB4_9GAMM|nr:MAG: Xanthine-uracil permease [uncultured Thiotrichaceae bacterium]
MNMNQPAFRYKLFSRNDSSAFWALFTDNLINLMVLSAVCQFVFQMPTEIVFGRIIPGAAVAIIAGVIIYSLLAMYVAKKTGRNVTALPYGISTPVMFVYLFGVIGPIYWATNDALLAWQVGIGAGFLGGIVAALGALVGPMLKKVTPRAGMLGTLCGIALVFIGVVPMAKIFEEPLVGFVSMLIVLWGLIGRFKLPYNIPAGLLALVTGTLIALVTGHTSVSFEGVGVYPPLSYYSDLMVGVNYLLKNPELFLVLVPVQIYNFIETMNNVESAEAAGDKYPVAVCQVTDGLGTMLGAFFGSPFPTTAYIGHPAYKRIGAHAGYIIGVGIVIPLAAFFGLLAFLNNLIPIAAAAPILVFVAISMISNTASSVKPTHMAAVAIAMIPHVSSFLITKWGSMMNALRETGVENLPGLTDEKFVGAMMQQGAHVVGHQALAQGAILTGLIWGAIAASVIDGKFRTGGGFALAAMAMSAVGIIHSASLHMPEINGIVGGYLIMGVFLIAYPMIAKIEQVTPDSADDLNY